MVPRTRLLIWTALVVVPFSVVAVASQTALAAALVAIGAFLLVAVGDAFLGVDQLKGIAIHLPGLVRLQKDREGEIDLEVRNESQRRRELRIGLVLPSHFTATEEERVILLPADTPLARIAWSCTPTRRGQFWLRDLAVESSSPLGFWAMRSRQTGSAELRVYPNLHDERQHVAALFLRRRRAGVHAQRSAGQGREFEKLREYLPGDQLGDVHWKASARRGFPIAKVYQVERTHEVYVLVDASRLAARPLGKAAPGRAIERYVSAALILALAAEQQGDQFGLITFSDRVLSFVRARSGPAHLEACRERLYALQPDDVSPDFEELFSLVRLRLRKRALLIILTALDDPVLAESFTKAADLLARQHLLLVNMLRPPEVAPLFTGAPAVELDDLYRALGGHVQWQKLRELQKNLQRRGVRLSFLEPQNLAADIIAQHADARARSLV